MWRTDINQEDFGIFLKNLHSLCHQTKPFCGAGVQTSGRACSLSFHCLPMPETLAAHQRQMNPTGQFVSRCLVHTLHLIPVARTSRHGEMHSKLKCNVWIEVIYKFVELSL